MTPSLMGRLQSRLVLMPVIGGLWTLLIAWLLPRPAAASVGGMYRITFEVLGLATALGLGWECAYHLLQQIRWDKDWPSLFALLAVVVELPVLWIVAHAVGVLPDGSGYVAPVVIHFVTTWIALWLFLQGPVRVIILRWRHNGGRLA